MTRQTVSFIRKHLPPTLHNAVGTIIATLVLSVGSLAALVPRFRGFVVAVATDHHTAARLWFTIILVLCVTLALFQVGRWRAFSLLPENVRLFRSLSGEERKIIMRLAESEYGLTEWELCQTIPVSTQHFCISLTVSCMIFTLPSGQNSKMAGLSGHSRTGAAS
jgi:hypothetical protein